MSDLIDEVLTQYPKLNELNSNQMDVVREAMKHAVLLSETDAVVVALKKQGESFKSLLRGQMLIRSIGVSACSFYLAGGWLSYLGEGHILLAAGAGILSTAATFYAVDVAADKIRKWLENRNQNKGT